ncbi:MAG: hypothetical protein GWP10_20235 [Nitrospiraceae bacterium]|nr:hypothetical protein [Nitrospiraceae bacterium]
MCDEDILDEEKIRKKILNVFNQLCGDLNVGYLEISDVLNVDSAYIFKLLKGKRKLTFSALIKLIYALNILNKRKGNPIDKSELKLSSILKKTGA